MQLTKEDLRDAMINAGVGVVKSAVISSNVACTAPEALLTQLNIILNAKEKK